MALKQLQTAPFHLRNPYRLDRPSYDPVEVWETSIVEEEETQRRIQQQNQHQQQTHSQQRPLPPQPSEDGDASTSWHGIKRIRDYQKKSSLEKRLSKQQLQSQQSQDEEPPSYNKVVSDNSYPQHHVQYNNYFGQSWFSQGAFNRTLSSTLDNVSTKGAASQMPVPTITVTHHIDSHSELTFERHVEWLTQTALWWDMPVVHLYPAPETEVAIGYVETAASKFASWVNFVKIPVKESTRLGPGATVVKAPSPPAPTSRVKGSRAIKSRRDSPSAHGTIDSQEDGGLVTVQSKQHKEENAASTVGSTEPRSQATSDSIIGYVFVGSADEQAQYHYVFETMERLYPKIEIRYINSFEPHHLQSRRQQELREEPCVHSLSWIHYWSAAKESQVLQSKIVNEVVRVRPMWVNNESLHRNYLPPPPPPSSVQQVSPTTPLVSTVSSDTLYTEQIYVVGEDTGADDPLRGVPSSVSILSLQEVAAAVNDEDTDMNPFQSELQQEQPLDRQEQSRQVDLSISSDDSMDEQEDDQAIISSLCLEKTEVRRRLLLKRPSLSRAQSSWDIRHGHHDYQQQGLHCSHDKILTGGATKSRRSKTWALNSYIRGESHEEGGASVATDYRRSVSTPVLAFSNKGEELDLGEDDDCNMSPPPSSPTSAGSPTSTSSDSSSKASLSSSSSSSTRLSRRLANLAQRLGVYKMRGSLVMVDM